MSRSKLSDEVGTSGSSSALSPVTSVTYQVNLFFGDDEEVTPLPFDFDVAVSETAHGIPVPPAPRLLPALLRVTRAHPATCHARRHVAQGELDKPHELYHHQGAFTNEQLPRGHKVHHEGKGGVLGAAGSEGSVCMLWASTCRRFALQPARRVQFVRVRLNTPQYSWHRMCDYRLRQVQVIGPDEP